MAEHTLKVTGTTSNLDEVEAMIADVQSAPVGTTLEVSRETRAEPLAALASMPWAIDEAALPVRLDMEDQPSGQPAAPGDHRPRAGTVAVIRAAGIVLPRCGEWAERYGWAISCERLPARIESAAGEGCSAVLVTFNSPGGSVAGVQEAAKRIAAVSSRVPVVAVADHLAASAAYWLASACTAVVASPSAMVGSVGVITVRPSFARELDMGGVDIDVFYRGEGKTDGLVLVEMDDDGRRRMQATIDAYYADFAKAVAAGRGVSRKTVADSWGAQVLTAQAAKAAGMVDQIGTADDVLKRLGTTEGRRGYRKMGATRSIVATVKSRLTQEGT